MTLTLGTGPLAAGAPNTTNYVLDGPRHKLLFSSFPRRIRAVVAGHTIVDSERAMLLHESNIFPVLYFPKDDISMELLAETEHSTHCPFKGDASYWTISAGVQVASIISCNAIIAKIDAQQVVGVNSVAENRIAVAAGNIDSVALIERK